MLHTGDLAVFHARISAADADPGLRDRRTVDRDGSMAHTIVHTDPEAEKAMGS